MVRHHVRGEYDAAEPVEDTSPEVVAEDLRERMSGFVGKLQEEADLRVNKRIQVEERWIEDLRQYHGHYSPEVLEAIRKKGGSTLYLNLTRPKTNAMMARLWDLLFPTDDRNWGIQPTPVPEMGESAEEVLQIADDAEEQFNAQNAELIAAAEAGDEEAKDRLAAEMEALDAVKREAESYAEQLHATIQEADRRANLMQAEIHDQLVEGSYQAECRDVIEDACKLGIGILKGPVLNYRTRQRWQKLQGGEEGGAEVYELSVTDDARPAAYRVDPWSFFPDPDARKPEDCEGFFERHLMSRKKLRKLAERDDMDKDAIRAVLAQQPNEGDTPSFITDLSALTGQKDAQVKGTYQVWEYTGPVDVEDMKLLAEAFDDAELLDEIGEGDPLVEYHAKVWFCQGYVFAFALHPLDSNEPIYSVYQLERDESSMFGFGIPYLLRHPQAMVNGAVRMMMDNAALSVGPQVVVNRKAVEPQDDDWTLKPLKVWERNGTETGPGFPPFETYDIPSNQQYLAAIIDLGRAAVDEEAGIPDIAAGEIGASPQQTAHGISMLMNAANVLFKRFVKNFDDDVTVPMVRRFYHWNMQFSDKEDIKGDYEVDARGSSVLLVREMQSQNLIAIAKTFGDHPEYGPLIKHDEVLKEIFRAHMLPAEQVTRSARELTKFLEEKKKQNNPEQQARLMEAEAKQKDVELRAMEIDAKVQIANMEADSRVQVAQLNYDADMMTLAEKLNLQVEELQAKMTEAREERMARQAIAARQVDANERRLAVEVAMKQRTGESSGGAI